MILPQECVADLINLRRRCSDYGRAITAKDPFDLSDNAIAVSRSVAHIGSLIVGTTIVPEHGCWRGA
jgi:hypothetical protein